MKTRVASIFSIAAIVTMSVCMGSALAWQLKPYTIKERLEKSDIVVVGRIKRIISRDKSLIMGVGDCMKADMSVTKAFKGKSPEEISVSWCEAVQAQGAHPMDEENIWFLKKVPDGSYQVPGDFEGVIKAAAITQAQIESYVKQ
jgi:hypothetical protein